MEDTTPPTPLMLLAMLGVAVVLVIVCLGFVQAVKPKKPSAKSYEDVDNSQAHQEKWIHNPYTFGTNAYKKWEYEKKIFQAREIQKEIQKIERERMLQQLEYEAKTRTFDRGRREDMARLGLLKEYNKYGNSLVAWRAPDGSVVAHRILPSGEMVEVPTWAGE